MNDAGKKLHESGLTGADISHEISRIIAEVDPWNIGGDSEEQVPKAETVDSAEEAQSLKSPQEQIEDLATEMNNSLGDELLALIMDRQPAFFEKVRLGYLALAAAEPDRIQVIDASTAPEAVHEAVWEKVAARLA